VTARGCTSSPPEQIDAAMARGAAMGIGDPFDLHFRALEAPIDEHGFEAALDAL
jgi:hypothetical protein